MELLITGSNGFLGKILNNNLKEKFDINTLNRTASDYNYMLDKEIPSFNKSFDVIIHAAGKAHIVPKTEDQKKEFYEVNFVGTQNLLKGLEKCKLLPQSFIFISSVSVYGLESGLKIPESTPLIAKDAYGKSKIEAENLIHDWCLKNNINCSILRLPLIVGDNPPGNLGDMIKSIKKGYYFNVDGGKAKKSMVLAEDVANVIPSLITTKGIYNLTDGYDPSFVELSTAICIKFNKSKPLSIKSWFFKPLAKLGDLLGNKFPVNSNKLKKIVTDYTFDDSKARKEINWNPRLVLKNL